MNLMENRIGNGGISLDLVNVDLVNEAGEQDSFRERLKGIKRPSISEISRIIREGEPGIDDDTLDVAISLAGPYFRYTKKRFMGTITSEDELLFGKMISNRLLASTALKIPYMSFLKGQRIISELTKNYFISALVNEPVK